MSIFSALGSEASGPSSAVYTLYADAGSATTTGADASYEIIASYARRGEFTIDAPSITMGRYLAADTGAFSVTVPDQYLNASKKLDPYRANVVLHMHADDFTDTAGNTATIIGSPAVATNIKKFGTGAILMPSSDGNYVRFADSDRWRFRTSPFTMEGWYYFTDYRDGANLLSHWYYGFAWWFADGNQLYLRTWNGDTAKYTFVPQNNRWYHFAIDRDATNTVRIYIDGVMVSKTPNFTSDINGSGYPLSVGTLLPSFYGYHFSGYYDEIRITKGVARYASDSGFTLQTAPFSIATLTCEAGSAALSGGEATFYRSTKTLLARPGPYYLFGRAANLSSAAAYSGTFSLAGNDATLRYYIPTQLLAAGGAFELASPATYLRPQWTLRSLAGRFNLVGGNAFEQYDQVLRADLGEWVVDPQSAYLRRRLLLRAATASYAVLGGDSSYRRGRGILAKSGQFALSGGQARLIGSRQLLAERLALALTGRSAGLIQRRYLRAQATAYTTTGFASSLRADRALAAGWATVQWSGVSARMFEVARLRAGPAAFNWTGYDTGRKIARRCEARTARFRLTAYDAEMWAGWGGDAVATLSCNVTVAWVRADGAARATVAAPSAEAAWSDR